MLSNKQITIINKYIQALKKYSIKKFGGAPICSMRDINCNGDNWTQVYYLQYDCIRICGHPVLLAAKHKSEEILFAIPNRGGSTSIQASEDDAVIQQHVKLSLNVN